MADILIGNEEDFQLALGFEGPKAEDKVGKIQAFQELICHVKEKYPNAQVFSTTLRTVENANRHLWGALMLAEGQWYAEEQREIEVYDRIGGGDGYVGGLLYGLIAGWEPAKWIQFGWACGALVATLATDYAQPANEEDVWSIYAGNARVKR